MRYGKIRRYDIANGPGVRTSIFITGCSLGCPGCFNEDYQDFESGKPWSEEEIRLVINYLRDENVSGLSILGGEPFDSAGDLAEVLSEIKDHVAKDIWIYSGYTYEKILKDADKRALLGLCDVLVDGPFVEDKKDLSLEFRGSSNQRIIDVKRSLTEKRVINFEFKSY